MVKVYYDKRSASSQRALDWFQKYNIKVEQIKICEIKKEDLIQLLSFSDEGINEIIKRPTKNSLETKQKVEFLMGLPLEQGYRFLTYHYEILQTPIIIDKGKYLIGYNEEEIRKFLPNSYRQAKKRRASRCFKTSF